MPQTQRLDGRPVAEALRAEIRAAVAEGTARGRPPPSVVSVHRGGATPFSVYLRHQRRQAEELGLAFRDEALPPGADALGLAEALARLDGDPSVDGVLVEHPLPPEMDFAGAVGHLSPEKDLDGVSAENLGRLVQGRPTQVPAVARAALRIARHYRLALAGRPVAVVGRSPTVGIPLALLLLVRGAQGDATVTVAHSQTPALARALAPAEVIFSAVGHPGLLDRSNVPEGASVIDVGLSTVPDPNRPGAVRSVGDADAASLEGWVGALTPVPGGVGPVTVAELFAGAVGAWRGRERPRDR